ncbi:2-hydroxyacid dehydrogenase [Fomitiporia mediterranea MF3/22]|uniref:2-hydroxyacid dehydrogenase n=1 Tax=Fomitiporia mediterranea (strain MF3/22) TaxID=694068 RepID=UPI0004408EDE|nr:2-hydroxyacid dehydrogenase [Fomitiporia mediterranea MF3/22]EJD08124.1 2-hydroxyacid dehydrogenase [Fomitiporia mediterranea MF3/22]
MSAHKVLICGGIVWAHDETKELLGSISQVVEMDSSSRQDFLDGFKQPGGKYAGTVGIYRHNESSKHIGVFDAELINALPDSVAWIAHNGAGYDQIDVNACKAKGIVVSNTPGAVDDATATTALYLIISSLRQFAHAEQNIRAGRWKSGLSPAHDPSSKTLSILGLGGIGIRLVELVRPFGMRILYHSRGPNPNAPNECEYFSEERLDEMLGQTDILSVHVPLRKETEGLVGEKVIRALKPGAVLVNTARGRVVDEEAMIRALEDGHLSAIGLDVYPDEPHVNPKLFTFPQATLLPHMGTETQESQRKMEVRALMNLRGYLTKGAGEDVVPELVGMKAKPLPK